MRESEEALVQKLGITKEVKVLDLGCGDGATAVPAAKLGANELGLDTLVANYGTILEANARYVDTVAAKRSDPSKPGILAGHGLSNWCPGDVALGRAP